MLLFIVLSCLMYLLLPALTSAHVTSPKDSVNPAAHHVKRLSTPLRNLLHKRDTMLSASVANASSTLALNSTIGDVHPTIPFEEQIDIPGLPPLIFFLVKGEIDTDNSVTVEFWVHYKVDRRIGVFYGDLNKRVDMKIPNSIKTITGEARLYAVANAKYDVLIFEAYGIVRIPYDPSKDFPPFRKEIKRWTVGHSESIQDVPDTSGVQTVSNSAGVDTSFSVE